MWKNATEISVRNKKSKCLIVKLFCSEEALEFRVKKKNKLLPKFVLFFVFYFLLFMVS